MIKLSDYVMERIADTGVKHVFFVPGRGRDALERLARQVAEAPVRRPAARAGLCDRVRGLLEGHRQFWCRACDGRPGGTNAITGVAGAWLDSTPCLFVSGQVKRADLKRDSGVRQMGVQELDLPSLVASITKYAVTVLEPAEIRFHLEKAIHLARTGRPGPVWIEIPLDVQAAMIEPETLLGFEPPREPSSGSVPPELVARAVAILENARRPVFLAGNGIRLARAQPDFRRLADRLGIPVLTTWLGIDLIPDDHPLFIGRPGAVAPRGANFAVQNADALLAVGARLDLVLTGYARAGFAPGARKIIVDVDPAELAKHEGRAEVAICADAGSFLRELSAQWRERGSSGRAPWLERCREWKTKYPIVLPQHREQVQPVSIYALADALSEELASEDVLVSGSSGSGIEIFLHAFRVREGQRILHTTALGAMGFGLPTSIGASVASGRRTIVVDGDGGFQFNIQELETVARLKLPIKFFVLNNGGYSSIRSSQRTHFGHVVAADASSGQTLPDLGRVAAAWGLPSRRIESQRNLREQLRDVLAASGPVVCDVVVVPDEDRLPESRRARFQTGR